MFTLGGRKKYIQSELMIYINYYYNSYITVNVFPPVSFYQAVQILTPYLPTLTCHTTNKHNMQSYSKIMLLELLYSAVSLLKCSKCHNRAITKL